MSEPKKRKGDFTQAKATDVQEKPTTAAAAAVQSSSKISFDVQKTETAFFHLKEVHDKFRALDKSGLDKQINVEAPTKEDDGKDALGLVITFNDKSVFMRPSGRVSLDRGLDRIVIVADGHTCTFGELQRTEAAISRVGNLLAEGLTSSLFSRIGRKCELTPHTQTRWIGRFEAFIDVDDSEVELRNGQWANVYVGFVGLVTN